jgi:hypothetical protein
MNRRRIKGLKFCRCFDRLGSRFGAEVRTGVTVGVSDGLLRWVVWRLAVGSLLVVRQTSPGARHLLSFPCVCLYFREPICETVGVVVKRR